MDKPKLIITHETVGSFDDFLGDYILVVESTNGVIEKVYSVKRPAWHKYYDKDYVYCVPNLN